MKIKVSRNTKETQIDIALNLYGSGKYNIKTGIAFFDHMLEQISCHGLFDIDIKAKGDIEVDYHHTVEDVGIVLGQAFNKAIGDKSGLKRFGLSYIPLDEALSRVVLDLSGRAGFFYRVNFTRSKIGNFDVDLCREFFQGFVNHAQITLHIDNLYGINAHHQAETIFKAFARALSLAVSKNSRKKGIISTKGSL